MPRVWGSRQSDYSILCQCGGTCWTNFLKTGVHTWVNHQTWKKHYANVRLDSYLPVPAGLAPHDAERLRQDVRALHHRGKENMERGVSAWTTLTVNLYVRDVAGLNANRPMQSFAQLRDESEIGTRIARETAVFEDAEDAEDAEDSAGDDGGSSLLAGISDVFDGYDDYGDYGDYGDYHDYAPNQPLEDLARHLDADQEDQDQEVEERPVEADLPTQDSGLWDKIFPTKTILGLCQKLPRLGRFKEYYDRLGTGGGEYHVKKLITTTLGLFQDGLSLGGIGRACRSTTEIPGSEGFDLKALFDSYQLPYEQTYTCSSGHRLGQKDEKCGHVSDGVPCDKKCVFTTCHFDIRTVLKHAMRDKAFAQNMNWGPNRLKEALAQGVEPEIMASCWDAPAVRRLHKLVPLTMDGDLPVLIELFIDGFQPNQVMRGIWACSMRVLNLPDTISSDYVFPVFFVDDKPFAGSGDSSKLHSIDASITKVVDVLGTYVDVDEVGTKQVIRRDKATRTYNDATGEWEDVRVYLHAIACDLKAMKFVAKHQMSPGKHHCHLCSIEGTVFRMTGTKGQGHGTVIFNTVDENGDFNWSLKDDESARCACDWAEFDAAAGDDHHLKGYRGTPIFAALPYVDITRIFLVCVMHQVHNTVVKVMKRALSDKGGFNGTKLAAFLKDTTVGEWGASGEAWGRQTGFPWTHQTVRYEAEELRKLNKAQLFQAAQDLGCDPKKSWKRDLLREEIEKRQRENEGPLRGEEGRTEVGGNPDDQGGAATDAQDCDAPDAKDGPASPPRAAAHDWLAALRNIFGKSWYNGYQRMLPWLVRRETHHDDRDVRRAAMFGRGARVGPVYYGSHLHSLSHTYNAVTGPAAVSIPRRPGRPDETQGPG